MILALPRSNTDFGNVHSQYDRKVLAKCQCRGFVFVLFAFLVISSQSLLLFKSLPVENAFVDYGLESPVVSAHAQSRSTLPPEPIGQTLSVRKDVNATTSRFAQVAQSTTKSFGFIHLGKCGGVSVQETLSGYLGRLTPIGRAHEGSKRYHLSVPIVSDHDDWILVVRDPVSRIQSWWTYDHPDNRLYRIDTQGHFFRNLEASKLSKKLFECYPTLDDLLTMGLAPRSNTTSTTTPDECQNVAQAAIPLRGSAMIGGLNHLRFNFALYFVPLLGAKTEKRIYVVRTEHMLNDMNSISMELGDTTNDVDNDDDKASRLAGVVHQSHWRSKDYPNKDRYISEKGMENLCRHLCNEIQIYKTILSRGINIGNETRTASLHQLYKSCPLQVVSVECPLGMSQHDWKTMNIDLREQEQKDMQHIRNAVKKRQNKASSITKSDKIQRHYQADQEEASYGFLHLGRCGGQTVRSLLESHKGQSKLYQKFVNGTWTSALRPLYWKHKHWVILMRDPLDRLLSWWMYHHPSNIALRPDRREQEEKPFYLRAELMKFYECYPTFRDFASVRLWGQSEDGAVDKLCHGIATRALSGHISSDAVQIPSLHDVHHSYKDYAYDLKTPSSRSQYFLFAVRTEFLSLDMNSIERMLTRGGGGAEPSTLFPQGEADDLKNLSSTQSWPVMANNNDAMIDQLDTATLDNLCETMCHHIQAYKYILYKAINLERDSYEMSMKLLRQRCPLQATKNGCPMKK